MDSEKVALYEELGWVRIPEPLGHDFIADMLQSLSRISRERRAQVVYEKDDVSVRAIHGCHRFDEACLRLVRHPLLVGVAESLLQQSVYVYQFKINMKAAFEGASWPWHQDFAFCHLEDGMPSPRAVNIAIHLDEVTPENGPLLLIPGSHRLGLLDVRKGAEGGDWRQHVSADLDYTVKDGTVSRLTDELGVTTIIGSQGYSFAFHPSILHASSANTSSERRALLIVTYNAVDNAPSDPSRPEFLVSRDTDAIIPLSI